MKRHTKLSSEQQQQQQAAEHQEHNRQSSAMNFASPEEMLRFDAAQAPVPPGIAERLQKSVASLTGAKSGWWRRWWGGGSS